jgi:quercetin dioxygenase-like cupin family protein
MVVEQYENLQVDGDHIIRRIFTKGESIELDWHRDRKDRTVYVISGVDWELQMDNELPKKLEQGKEYYIEKNTFHRVFSGKDDLLIRIEEE